MSATWTVSGITPAQYASLQAAAAKAGIPITGTRGTITAHGCTIAYNFPIWPGAASAALTIDVVEAPPFCAGMALHKIHDLIEGVLSAPVAPAEKSTL